MSTNRNQNTFAVMFPSVSLGQKSELSTSLSGIVDLRNDVGAAATDTSAGSGGLSQALQTALQAAGTAVARANQQLEQLLTSQQKALQSTDQNTQALMANTASKSGVSATVNTLGEIGGNMFSGSILAPIISGIIGLFGNRSSQPTFEAYLPPLPVQVNQTVGTPATANPWSAQSASSNAAVNAPRTEAQVTVQVNAIDSQSFLDHSDAIAQAVRQALLNSHPLGDVISEL